MKRFYTLEIQNEVLCKIGKSQSFLISIQGPKLIPEVSRKLSRMRTDGVRNKASEKFEKKNFQRQLLKEFYFM